MKMFVQVVLVVAAAAVGAASSRRRTQNTPHDHGGGGSGPCGGSNWEWSGFFHVPGDTYVWRMQAVNGQDGLHYADPSMKIVFIPVSSSSDAAATLDSLVSGAETTLGGTCTSVNSGQTILPTWDQATNTGSCFELQFSGMDSEFMVNLDYTSNVAIFTQHEPTEFERDSHYFLDANGLAYTENEPVATCEDMSTAVSNKFTSPDTGTLIAGLAGTAGLVAFGIGASLWAAITKDD